MVDRAALESAVLDVEGSMALFGVMREALLRHGGQQWDRVGAAPQEGMCVAVFSEEEWRAVDHASETLRLAVEKLSATFYGRAP